MTTTSRIEEATRPMVKSHCNHDPTDQGGRYYNQPSERETARDTDPFTAAWFTNISKVPYIILMKVNKSADSVIRRRSEGAYILEHVVDAKPERQNQYTQQMG